jgi:hypothetical protein
LSRQDIEDKFMLNAKHGGYDDTRAAAALKVSQHLLDGPINLSALRG